MGGTAHRQPHVLKPCLQHRKRNFLYVATEYIDGQTLRQWLVDNPKPSLETVRGIVEQVAKGLRAFHRKEMLHQDVRPDNIMIDATGTVKIIDFGSTRITGVVEATPSGISNDILGTQQFTAPEYFLGEPATSRSDLFSLGVHHLSDADGKVALWRADRQRADALAIQRAGLPPGPTPAIATCRNGSTARWRRRSIPIPAKRYDSFSEFLFDLRHPNANYLATLSTPLIERNPLLFWKCTTILLALGVIVLLAMQPHAPINDGNVGVGQRSPATCPPFLHGPNGGHATLCSPYGIEIPLRIHVHEIPQQRIDLVIPLPA